MQCDWLRQRCFQVSYFCASLVKCHPSLFYAHGKSFNVMLGNVVLTPTLQLPLLLQRKVDFTSFFPRFAGSDVLIQCMSTTTRSLSNQTFYWSNAALSIPDAQPDEYQRYFCTVLNSRPFALKPASLPLHHGWHSSFLPRAVIAAYVTDNFWCSLQP